MKISFQSNTTHHSLVEHVSCSIFHLTFLPTDFGVFYPFYDMYLTILYMKYNHLKKKIKSELSKAKISWIGSYRKDLWRTVRQLSGKAINDPLTSLRSVFSSKRAAADSINEKFASDCS